MMIESKNDQWLSSISLQQVIAMFLDNGVSEVFYKVLPRNANSKNQVYLGGKDPSEFAKLPTGEMTAHVSVSEKTGKQEPLFKAALEFYWMTGEGNLARAPSAKMIFYPQYPEVRFSGFLKGCKGAPSSLWSKEQRGTEPGRILLLGTGNERKIIGLTLPPESPAAKEIIESSEQHEMYEIFRVLPMPNQRQGNGFLALMHELCSIHRMGYVASRRLDKNGLIVPCNASNCNGNTLEALLGIRSNGHSLPDFMGWEVKARQVPNADVPTNSVVTLFTPEPTTGIYGTEGFEPFIRRYGYPDRRGRSDRLNVGGIHRASISSQHDLTGLRLVLDGYDPHTKSYTPTGCLQLVDAHDKVAAGWPFAKLMDHWKIKHAQAAYVPAQPGPGPDKKYRFGRDILIGEGAEFKLLLHALHEGKVYYDPGNKLEGVSTAKPTGKKRNQFRVSSKDLPSLYRQSRIVDTCEPTATPGMPSDR